MRHPRPQFQPKANVPMVAETRDRLALEIRLAAESLINHPTIDAYNTLSKMFASLARAGMAAALLDLGSQTLNGICGRFEASGRIAVKCEEAERLRQVVASIDANLHRVPLQRFTRAVAEVEVFAGMVNPADAEDSP